eukprot:GFKZ01014652.1.p1 GENE.GFKZ01014652.1~~GFKZ01014652.1.p1  ORF type:complete len:159 (-),score=20.74 GFKZ01014652.1:88-564(-)
MKRTAHQMSPVTLVSDSTPPSPPPRKRTRTRTPSPLPTTTTSANITVIPTNIADRSLPSANISRIMRSTIPTNCKIAKDAKQIMQTCLSAFIALITAEAAQQCNKEKRKTMNGDDLLAAVQCLGFDQYVHPLKLYLLRYRTFQAAEKEQWCAEAPCDA